MPSLLQSLSDLQDVAPADEEEQQDDSRAHYADVGPSVRRRKANLTEAEGVLGGKYEGREARLRDLNLDGQSGEDSESGSGSEDEEEESELDSDEELESEDEEIHSSASSSSSSSSSSRSSPRLQPAKKSVRFDKDTQGASMSVKEANGTSSNGASRTLSSSLSSQAQLTKSLREQAREDALKGEAIQQQLSFWQRTLENRIKVDKVIGGRGLGRVDPAAYSSLLAASDAQDEHDALTSSLLDHSALLLDTQTKLIGQQDGHDQLYEAIEKVGSKRKRAEGEEDSLAAHSQLLSLTLRFGREVLDPFTAATLNRHSTRNSGQSDNSFSATLKTFEQSLIKQIDAAMAGEGGQRLVERTRKYRGEGRRIGAPSTEGEGEAQNGNSDADSSVSADTFDDSDFYASLLRSLIESSSTGGTSLGGQLASNTPLQFHARTNTKIKGIDTRASKGRKLRYEVIEKIANFMPKIANREKWSEEMRGRLIDVLPGGAAGGKRSKGEQQQEGDDEEDEEEEIQQAPLQDLGGLRLFG